MPTCIWCLTENAKPSVEHIIPEALGCPEGFVLTDGVVCKSCNNGLAHLDRAVVDDFDMVAFLANVPRKGGRPPTVRGRGNLVATMGNDGPKISVNMDPEKRVAHDGSPLGAFGQSKRNVKATVKRDGNTVDLSYSATVGENPKFVRGITKIAFSCFAYYEGSEAALSERFAPVRAFVRNGMGERPVLMMLSEDRQYRNEAWRPYKSENHEYSITFRLAVAEFLVDLSPRLSLNALFKKGLPSLYPEKNWGWIPPSQST
jgi:hypothetical protein